MSIIIVEVQLITAAILAHIIYVRYNVVMYLHRGWLRCGNSQQHVGHLVDDQLCDQLFVFLHMLTNQRHGAVHHLQGQQNSQSGLWMTCSCRKPNV